ncbi:MAG: TonB-dependent siderophore receptor [Acidobacteria bacterium]|nr:TonB-dependent siderophore receptor [Acidobacteriota bacterium]
MRENFNPQSKAFISYIFLLLSIFALALTAFSQTSEKCFRGTVKDSANAVIIGAEIVLKNAKGKTIDRAETDNSGEFALNCFERGEYVLSIFKEGMSPIVKNLSYDKEKLQVSDIVLETQTVAETVTVEIEPEFISSTTETATKTATLLRDVPQSVEIVNRRLLDSQAVRSLQDALFNVTAVSAAQGEGRRDQFFIRGFSAIGDQFIDGVRDDAQYYRDLSNIEQIEVVKGPSAVLFGRGSSGGIINRVTKKPNVYERIGSAEVNFGSYGLKRGMFDFGQPVLQDKLAFRFVGSYEKTGSFRHYFFQDRYNIAPSIAWKPTEKTDITFQFEYLNDERVPDRGIPSYRGRPVDIPIATYYGFPERDHITTRVSSQAIRFEQQINNFWTLRNVFRRIHTATDFYNTGANGICVFSSSNGSCAAVRLEDPIFPNDRLGVTRFQYNGNFKQNNTFNQTEVVGKLQTFGWQHTILGGVELGYQAKRTIRNSNTTPNPVSLLNPDLSRPVNIGSIQNFNDFDGKVLGIYVQDQINLTKQWKALLGVRYDSFVQKLDDLRAVNQDLQRTDCEWSPRVGLVYQPNEWLSFYGSYSRSFQPSGENLSLAANNDELGPELTRNYEGGIKAQFQPFRLNATLAVFRLDRNNIKTNDPLNPTQLILIGEQRTDGIEFTVSGSPTRKLDVYAGYALLDAHIIKSNTVSAGIPLQGKSAQLTPRSSGNLWLTYQLPKQFRLGFGGYTRTKTFTSTNNLVTLPGYARFDASLSWRSEKHYEIAFNLKNITNKRYYETSNGDNGIQPGSPVNGSVTLRYRW